MNERDVKDCRVQFQLPLPIHLIRVKGPLTDKVHPMQPQSQDCFLLLLVGFFFPLLDLLLSALAEDRGEGIQRVAVFAARGKSTYCET